MENTHLVLVNSLIRERSDRVRIHHNLDLFAGSVVANTTLNLSLLLGTLEKRVSKTHYPQVEQLEIIGRKLTEEGLTLNRCQGMSMFLQPSQATVM
jgi:hypothetical protein